MIRILRSHPHIAICVLLALLVLVVYWQASGFGFVNFDDGEYVFKNPNVQHGFTLESIRWAFNVGHAGNWHPLTWFSHLLDWRLFGAKAGGHHVTNVLIHTLNVLLLFLVLLRMTGCLWRSAFVAAVFAIHPLHVESVAWVSERKDVLGAFFWLLTLWAYARYTDAPSTRRYLLVVLAFALGLMAKPMLVTLPVVLLLMDYWPLSRFSRSSLRSLLLEKAPLLAIAVGSSVVTMFAQSVGTALIPLDYLSLPVRIENALVSYVVYVWKTLWPARLAVFYANPEIRLSILSATLCGLALLVPTVFAYKARRARPYLLVGALWYLVTLLPVIGLVQVSTQVMADRYTYIPMIGLLIVAAWGIPEAMRPRAASIRADRRTKANSSPFSSPTQVTCASMAVIAVLALTVVCYGQVGVWRDSVTLFRHATEVTDGNDLAHGNLGNALQERGDIDGAVYHLEESVRINPINPEVRNDLALALEKQGDEAGAIEHYRKSLRLRPNWAKTHNDLGVSLAMIGRFKEAIPEFREAVRLTPDYADAHINLGAALASVGKKREAIPELLEGLRLNPNDADAHSNVGVLMESTGRRREGILHLREALRLEPERGNTRFALAVMLYNAGSYNASWSEIHLLKSYGGLPDPGFIKNLSKKMPEPR